MQKTKSFNQYSKNIDNFHFYIYCTIDLNGKFRYKSRIYFKNDDKARNDNKKWFEDNKEYRKGYSKKYRENNKEKIEQYYLNDRDNVLEKQKQYRKDNILRISEWYKQYYINNKQKINEKIRKYRRTERGILTRKRSESKRREFGFDPINDYFEGAHFHHTHENDNHDIGIFMPAELHNGIWHSNKNQESMDRINEAAYEWLENNNRVYK